MVELVPVVLLVLDHLHLLLCGETRGDSRYKVRI
jgi:hypothetical protein